MAESLRDLSAKIPGIQELNAIIAGYEKHDDRAFSLVLCSILDIHLEDAMRPCFVEMGKDRSSELFRDRGAALGSFSTKIVMGYALGLYDGRVKSHLDRLRTIRNHFAHCSIETSFKDPLVVAECQKLTPELLFDNVVKLDDPRAKFLTTATSILIHILKFQIHRMEGTNAGVYPKPHAFPCKPLL